MATPPVLFRYEIEMRGDETTVKCHGKVVYETATELKDLVKPLIPKCRTIVVDLTDVTYVDSSGLGTLIGLKVSAALAAYCSLEFVNLSPRVQELLHITKLTSMFKSNEPTAAQKPEEKAESFSVVATKTGGEGTESDVSSTLSGPIVEEEEDHEPESFAVVAQKADGEGTESDVSTTLSGPVVEEEEDHEAESSTFVVEEAEQEKIEPGVPTESGAPAGDVSRKSVPRKKAAKMAPKNTAKKAVKKPVKKPIEKAAKKKIAKKIAPPRRSTDR